MKFAVKIRFYSIALGTLMALSVVAPKPAMAGSNPILGELMLFGGSYCPRGWAGADGKLMAVQQNPALFSIFGQTYGGDGRTTFALPDLRGRAPIHIGGGAGLANYSLGEKGGTESLTVGINNMPSHNHGVQATNQIANKNGPGTDFLAVTSLTQNIYHDGPPNKMMDPAMITNSGGGQAISKRSPYLALRWCVAIVGTYPVRN